MDNVEIVTAEESDNNSGDSLDTSGAASGISDGTGHLVANSGHDGYISMASLVGDTVHIQSHALVA